MDLGHWIYPLSFIPMEWEGFIYRVVDNETHREYIGKKSFLSRRSKKVKNRTNRVHQTVESNWKKYTSSSASINELITKHGKDRFTFMIESLHKTKAALTYAEVEKMITEDVLRARLEDGSRKYYNGVIPPIKFLPPYETSDEEATRIFSVIKAIYPNLNFAWEASMADEEKEQYKQKYRFGRNNATSRKKTPEEYEKWLAENFLGENNLMFGVHGELHWGYGKKRPDSVKEKISAKNKGTFTGGNKPRFGKSPFENFTPEELDQHKKMLSEKMSGENNPMYGKRPDYKMTEEEKEQWKLNISKGSKGKPKSEQCKEKMRHPKGPQKKLTCPHCSKEGGAAMMKRYHFDKCKFKP